MTQLQIARKEYLDQMDKMAEIEENGDTPTDNDFNILHQKWRALEMAGAHLSPLSC